MSIEFSGAGFSPEPIKQEQPKEADLEQTMQAVRDAIRSDTAQQNERTSESQQLSADDIAEAAEAFAELAQNMNRDLRFSVSNDLEQPIIRVIDRSSGEMIRQIPSEEVVELALKIRQFNSDETYDSATGLLIDSRV
ncbi:MAG: flagellar protein FlaG [Idiomarina sp.]|nr:flagellar protein FlaG [Idiomarina sp.]